MLNKILTLIFGTKNERELKKIRPLAEQINQLEPDIARLSDADLRGKTAYFKEKLSQGATLEDILPEAFAVTREAGKRVLNMRHFDVQLIGGIALHQGKIAEMKTGEGKTLVATLPAYLNGLTGKGVHIVTVNDYLARRDAEWMGRIYESLGLTVGCLQHDLDDEERQAAYGCDITYGTNTEYGFDYLRDNMKFSLAACVQRGYHYAIVDEVDSILIDEARTPLIISGPSEESTDKYYRINSIIPRLAKNTDYQVDEKAHTVFLTEAGSEHAERWLNVGNLYEPKNWDYVHHINQALKAHVLFKLDVDYVIKDGEVVIVDEFTGRLMPGRRWSDGLHQAVEAKEGVRIERENQTLATITLQNYFRMYKKLAGMTGTAETEASEFLKIYKLEVLVIPTNRLLLRGEFPDVIFRTDKEKYLAVVEEIKSLHAKGQPTLVGTISIENSERLSTMLQRANVPHVVLNAKYHEREAEIVAQAGRKGAVTIATNMAGRGTDILLGGNVDFLAKDLLRRQDLDPRIAPPEQWAATLTTVRPQVEKEHEDVVSLGGLHIIGTERHEARRIDNQLRGRAGRQGDPGSSRFYMSLDDNLLRIFGGERLQNIMTKIGMEEGVPIESRLVSRQIESAQQRVEGRNFEARKHLLEYDDVMNKQREAIYAMRRELLETIHGTNGAPASAAVADSYEAGAAETEEPPLTQKERILERATSLLHDSIDQYAGREKEPEEWDFEKLRVNIGYQFGIDLESENIHPRQMNFSELVETLENRVKAKYDAKESEIGTALMREHERIIMLSVIDSQWKDHLLALDHLKEGIGLRGYGQRDPLIEYKKESFTLFEDLLARIDEETTRYLFLLEPVRADEERTRLERRQRDTELVFNAAGESTERTPARREGAKVGRNEPCPCGSGKKFKKCHGRE
ncbi:MAG: preprotein translocase subunit SecA [Acidobacteria bacterium]|nr:preprotein translocase subunit SecA [Acidobacteriota bacterium]